MNTCLMQAAVWLSVFLYRKLMLFLDKIGFVNIIYIEKIQKGDRQLWT